MLVEELKKFETDDPEVKELIDKLLQKLEKHYHCVIWYEVDALVNRSDLDTEGVVILCDDARVKAEAKVCAIVKAGSKEEAEQKREMLVEIPKDCGVCKLYSPQLQIKSIEVEEVTPVEVDSDPNEAICPFCKCKANVDTVPCKHYVAWTRLADKAVVYFKEA